MAGIDATLHGLNQNNLDLLTKPVYYLISIFGDGSKVAKLSGDDGYCGRKLTDTPS